MSTWSGLICGTLQSVLFRWDTTNHGISFMTQMWHIFMLLATVIVSEHTKRPPTLAAQSTLQLAKKVGHDTTNANVRSRITYQQGKIAGTNRYLLVEKQALPRRHYNIGVTLKNLEDSLGVCAQEHIKMCRRGIGAV